MYLKITHVYYLIIVNLKIKGLKVVLKICYTYNTYNIKFMTGKIIYN